MEGVAGAIRNGGDNGANLEGNLPTEAPLALFSGVVKVGADGTANVAFDIPGFNGSVRVMAVAWSKSKVGSAEATVYCPRPRRRQRDAAALSRARRPFGLACRHRQCRRGAGEYKLDLDLHGPLAADADALSAA